MSLIRDGSRYLGRVSAAFLPDQPKEGSALRCVLCPVFPRERSVIANTPENQTVRWRTFPGSPSIASRKDIRDPGFGFAASPDFYKRAYERTDHRMEERAPHELDDKAIFTKRGIMPEGNLEELSPCGLALG